MSGGGSAGGSGGGDWAARSSGAALELGVMAGRRVGPSQSMLQALPPSGS